MNPPRLAQAWMFFGALWLMLSGLLAVPMLLGKLPLLRGLFDPTWTHWSLVVHVILSLLVWHTCIPIGMVHWLLGEPLNSKARGISLAGLAVTGMGALLLLTIRPAPGVQPILSNYLPVITHPQFGLGVGLCFLGLVLGFAVAIAQGKSAPECRPTLPGLLEASPGLALGALYFTCSALALVLSCLALKDQVATRETFELMMWGPGHLMQHASASFLMVALTVLASSLLNQPVLSPRALWLAFGCLAIPLLLSPYLLSHPVNSEIYRVGFTRAMRWGIFPGFLVFFAMVLPRLSRGVRWSSPEGLAFLGSSGLILLGFIFGSMIRGWDLRVPGHYHATIGSITLAFMALTVRCLAGTGPMPVRIRSTIICYTVGQFFFASGLFIAGSFGIPRKTYGIEVVISNAGQLTGFAVLAVGGLLAFLGGSLFASTIFELGLRARGKMLDRQALG